MAKLGVTPIVIAHILNHVSVTRAGVTLGVYAVYTYDAEKREALTLWANRLAGIAGLSGQGAADAAEAVMPRGGKRDGAGRKARVLHYQRRLSIGRRELKIGQRCEKLWREAYKTNTAGMHWSGERRPHARKMIIMRQVAEEFGETVPMIDRLWKEYRQFEADLDEDLPV